VEVEPPAPFEGKSLAPTILAGEPSHRDLAVSGCFIRHKPQGARGKATTPFLATERWGYAPVGAQGKPELFDLAADPLAENDIAEEHPEVVAELHRRLLEHLREHNAPEETVALWEKAGEEAARGEWAIDYPGSI